jgi:NADH dehydrogenase FAD-containing subunit
MRTVYVIGAGVGSEAVETAKQVLQIKGDFKIVCVEDMEEIPLKDRLSSVAGNIMTINKITAPPIIPQVRLIDFENKRKGHERPYKYHK